ncbi:MAG: hypothetical protein H0V61_09250 [Chitinophagales bacterium]|nr:hypothetical protein [Chitinophagales bacterium]
MRMIPTKIHGILDYVVGILLIAAPWLFGFAFGGAEMYVPVALGISAIVYSLFTNYELGALRLIPMTTHLWLDLLSGIFLAASPWLLNFHDKVYLPHLLAGVTEIVVSLLTQRKPFINGK